MAVDNPKQFHEMNLAENKEHYTYFVRFTAGKPLTWVHKYGAKMHFNTIKIPGAELLDKH